MTPDRKVLVGGVAGALTSIIVWSLSQKGIVVPAEIAVAISTVVTFATQYFTPGEA